MSDEEAMVYAFGETWGPEKNKADKYFGFKPGRGIHDIHFNQGNPPGRFASQNGPWQDGGLLCSSRARKQWVGVFLEFQSQAWHSDDGDGRRHHSAGSRASGRAHRRSTPTTSRPSTCPTGWSGSSRPTSTTRDTGTRDRHAAQHGGRRRRPRRLADQGQAEGRDSRSAVRSTPARRRDRDQAPVALSNKGGIITLLNARA